MLIIQTTTPSKKEAKRLISLLLKSHLVACVQYHKIKSAYLWADSKKKKVTIHKRGEWLLTLKSNPTHYKDIESLIISNHSYKVPEIIAFKADAQASYQNWLDENLVSKSADA